MEAPIPRYDRFRYGFFDDVQGGKVSSRLDSDVTGLGEE